MNRCYRLVWNRARRLFVVASEISRTRGKVGRTVRARRLAWLAALPLSLVPALGMAAASVDISGAMLAPRIALRSPPVATPVISSTTNPGGGRVTAGSGNISQSGLTTTINQHSQHLSLNWYSFNIGADSTVNFVQPDAQSIAVNRIADANGSVILGRLNANGQVFLINPNGVLFGSGAQVNVGGLVASTLNLSDSELASGTRHFSGADSGRGSVVNRGTINAAKGGYVALLGPQVTNRGTLNAPGGTVALVGGNAVTLSFDSNRLLSLQVDQSTLNALADNRQLIVADGGQVLMSAGARDSLLASVVNNSGTLQARTVENRAGKIVLLGGMAAGTTHVAGTLDASAPDGGHAGFVETSAAHVAIAPDARITTVATNGQTGIWLIDPVDYTIAASGGDITGTQLGTNLATSNITILSSAGTHGGTNGDINVNDSVSWSAHKLTLNAHNNININTALNGSGTASLALEYGQGAAATGNTSTVNVRAPVNLPAGDNFSTRLGSDGTAIDYKVITSLGVAGSATAIDLQGISGNLAGNYVLGANIDASATSGWNGIAGFAPLGDATTYFTGTFDGLGHTITGLTIYRPTTNYVGLFGFANSTSTIRNIGMLGGSATGQSGVGGLAGVNFIGSTITNAYATGTVTGIQAVGGLVGNNRGTIDHAYATGTVSGQGEGVGGLVGQNQFTAISHVYATGKVTNTGNRTGGLVGSNNGAISEAYATGTVSGVVGSAGGLIGFQYAPGSVSASYWDSFSTNQIRAIGNQSSSVVAITSDPAQAGAANYAFKPSAYAGFDFTPGTGTWFMIDASTRPFLQSEYSTTIGNAHQLQLMAMDLGAGYTLESNIDAAAVGVAGADMWGSKGFVPIGNSGTKFTGTFDGLGHTISGLTINRPSTDYVGLFGHTNTSSAIRNLGLLGGSVIGQNNVGGLVGKNDGTISQAYATGTVSGSSGTGGLAGFNTGAIHQAHATGAVSGNFITGGLVGTNFGGTINQAYAAGAVNGISDTGGLAGTNSGSISQAYASGAVSGSNNTGGLVGTHSAGTINQAYATGAVSGDFETGGLAGRNAGAISQAYATGAVNGDSDVGGLIGINFGTATDSYWDTETTGQASTDGTDGTDGTGLTTAQMKDPASFAAWGTDISAAGGSTAIWRIYSGDTAPLLRAFMSGLAITDVSATYNGTDFAGGALTFGTLTPSYWLPSTSVDSSLVLGDAQASTPAINVGSYTLGGGLYSGQMGYDIDVAGGTVTINPAALTLSTSNVSKTYDGSLGAAGAALVTGGTLFGSDTLSGGSFAFTDKNAGTGKHVTVAGVTVNDGNDGKNYAVTYATNTASTITALGVTVDATGTDRVYDGSTADAVTLASAGVLSGDTVNFTGTGSFADKHVGTDKTVSVSGITASGSDAGNYSFNTTAATTANITAAALTLSTSNVSKTYDGGLSASGAAVVTGGTLFGSDTLSGGSFAFTNKNAGTGKHVTVAGVTVNDGNDGKNYAVTYATNTASTITALGVTVDATGTDRAYDGSTADAVTLASAGVLSGDTVNFTGTGSFADKHVGTAKAVSVSGITASGSDAGNYSFNTTAATTANITAAALTLSTSNVSKTYDGGLSASGAAVVTGGTLFGSDTLSGGSFAFTNKNAGTGKHVTVAGVTVNDGNDGKNYAVTYAANIASTITALGVTVDATGTDRAYDGSTADAVSLTSSGLLVGDSVSFSGTGAFADKHVGTAKAVSVSGITASGSDAGNYSFNTTAATTADITAAALTLSTSNVSKTYDGSLGAAGAALVTGGTLFGSDTLSGGSFAFTDKNAGTGKHVTVAGVTVNDGNDGKNYAVTYATNTASTITALGVTVDAAGTNRVYDGSTADAVTLASAGVLSGDRVAFSGTGAFGDKHVGTDKTVSVSGITARGSDAGNYSFNTTATTTADITALGITVDATGADRVYDGGIADAVTLASAGVLSGDTVNFSGTGSFADKHAGAAKAVSVSGIAANGADAGNYSFNTTADTTADISRLGITVDATARDRVYDATTNATVALGSGGILVGDVVNFTGTGSFADKNAGTDKTVAINGIAANGADAGNYSFNTTAGTTATITLATLTYLADPALVQRGQTPDSLGGTVTGLVGGESLDEATDGTLAWQTPATAASPAGAYAIDGNGLSALNYVVVQAPGNATALQVIDGAAPDSVGIPGLVVSTVAGLQQSDDSDKPHAPNAPDVHIVDGGVRLP